MLRSSLFFQIAQFEFFGFFAELGFWFINESVGLTNGSRGIANAWRLWCKIEVQCLQCVF
ncbi:hypothetical protein EAY24_12020 [Vibrio anguillarum]|uniref:Uncharacterized protein n=1 Tax=Vibrio anguillarum TaxID=55601 RepID=A0AAW4ANM9_VIBAN|nr:hypothetical protein CEA93_16570 [Vibrio anguillarum]ATA51274.1 hypothetical protein CLI14_16490 [Vibrio anguillarum]AVT65819.1 hypothetical protein B5S57_01030 [Vibrio anguillarum]MBF4217360.1 hypothetical protein [Vibrio anguillarum]MBF4236596.1 hypothetical protein [Vibrio anguillarum]